MEVLITGAPGWLGTELVRRLDDSEHTIRCLTLAGVDTSELDPYDVETYPGDIRQLDTIVDAFDDSVDIVFHCAGIIHPSSLFGADQFFKINANGTLNMLKAARKHDIDHFVYVSSNAAQGFNDSPNELMTEEMPCQPESNYGESKYMAEQHVRRYNQEYGLDFTIVRPCWYYGPRQPERMNRLMRMIEGGKPIVFGNGMNLRSMTYVPSLVDALVSVMERPSVSTGETYWIADERPYTTNYIYRTIADLLGVSENLQPIYVPTPISRIMEIADVTLGNLGIYEQNVHVAGEMSRNIACDPSKAISDLDWEPPTDLVEGMRAGVQWAREHDAI
ncbi:NAD-dependent epimerase/dehydratase family protein [Haloplanus natans]|uniref:NAD-dependent epimerase/dehydratase family protein n=1 Tax=Haloplanus natans TaxID=376171 RepID=UPI001B7F7FC0|nr:NAD(P)-dependent oxidoreductase [Haloplanus natans]